MFKCTTDTLRMDTFIVYAATRMLKIGIWMKKKEIDINIIVERLKIDFNL